ncbi:MAG: hypothetical protein BWY64_02342 [bacterium ADurb.Bin363]|nr:MAG: hypothetical protein BWY64_02342 [bacterium ADurb.Bin363]
MPDKDNKNNFHGIAGKIALTFFLLIFFAAGFLGTVFMGREAWNTIRSYTWIKTEFTSLSSEIKEDDEGYSLIINYKYDFQGKSYNGEYKKTSVTDYSSVNADADKYKTGSKGICYVNPSCPSSSILKHKNLCLLPFILTPLVFVFVASFIIYGLWTGDKRRTDSEPVQAISKKSGFSYGNIAGALFFGIFFIAGIVATYYLTYKPLVKFIDAQSWPETPCRVISSRILTHEGDESTTYSADILYVYNVKGIEYKSNRYRYFSSSSSHREAARLKNKYPPGRETVCYVNPSSPGEATLKRNFTKVMPVYFFPVLFVLVGAGGIYGFLKKDKEISALKLSSCGAGYEINKEGLKKIVKLKPKISRYGKFTGLLIFALLWNGIISFPLTELIEGFKKVSIFTCFAIAIIPFVLIGLFLAGSCIYYFLKLFNPLPELVLSCHPLIPGEAAELSWTTGTGAGAVKKYRIYIEGREEVKYNDSDDHHTFCTINLAETENLYEIEKGNVSFTLPEDTIHFFESEHNKIAWSLHLVGKMKYWFDIHEEFSLTVLPKNMLYNG